MNGFHERQPLIRDGWLYVSLLWVSIILLAIVIIILAAHMLLPAHMRWLPQAEVDQLNAFVIGLIVSGAAQAFVCKYFK